MIATTKTGSTDPGGHNRNATNWDTKGGHYGHSHTPENDHWDPGYTPSEVKIIMGVSLESVDIEEGGRLTPFISQEEIEILENLSLTTYSISVSLDKQGQGLIPLDIAWERIISLIPKATKNEDGNWVTCTVSLAEADGQTLLVATQGTPETTVTILVKVLDNSNLIEESVGCP